MSSSWKRLNKSKEQGKKAFHLLIIHNFKESEDRIQSERDISVLIKYFSVINILCILMTGCAHEQRNSVQNVEPDIFVQLVSKSAIYCIQPNDLLRIQLYEDKIIDQRVRVEQDGTISMPLVGVIEVGGHGAHEVELKIAAAYHKKYILDPHVSVFIEEKNANRFTVTGAVTQPGLFEIKGQFETLQQAVAEAKGVSQIASIGNVVIFRVINGKKMMARFDLDAIEKGKIPDPTIQAGDIVVVIRSNARAILKTIIEMTPFVMVWRAYR